MAGLAVIEVINSKQKREDRRRHTETPHMHTVQAAYHSSSTGAKTATRRDKINK